MSATSADALPTDLVADIGGTNARFALVRFTQDGPQLQHERSLRCAEFASLQHAAEHYLAQVGAQPRRAAIAVASPVRAEDQVRMTNLAWAFSRSELQQRLGLQSLRVINDFGAIARAIPVLGAADRVVLHGRDDAPLQGPVSVLGPGTGLGVAYLVNVGGWHALDSEGGHVSFAPQNEEESLIARWISARHGRCSTERLLSGEGLSNIHAALSAGKECAVLHDWRSQLRDPAAIVTAALDGHDGLARRTLARFCAVLGSVAGDTALIHGARTVMIAGGIVPRFLPFLRSSVFRERFLAKGRFAAVLESVQIAVVTHPQPGLLGAAVALAADC
jgi:glucokinase